MKNPLPTRPLDKVLYRPISTQNAREQAKREQALERRRASTSIRSEKTVPRRTPF
jgi:hypothetical protein